LNKNFPDRRSIRLKNYDYSQPGYYFITICCQHRLPLFGKIHNARMQLNHAGEMINAIWHKIPEIYANIKIDAFVIMPDHIHGIIQIVVVGADSISAPTTRAEIDSAPTAEINSAPTLSTIVQMFKRYTTIEYIKMVKQNIVPPFNKRLWQRNYWEHIIRNETALNRIRNYIYQNVGADSISARDSANRAEIDSAPTDERLLIL